MTIFIGICIVILIFMFYFGTIAEQEQTIKNLRKELSQRKKND